MEEASGPHDRDSCDCSDAVGAKHHGDDEELLCTFDTSTRHYLSILSLCNDLPAREYGRVGKSVTR